jgi:hypothetical protein
MPRFNDNFYDGIIKATVELNKNCIHYIEKQKGIIIVKGVKLYSFSEKWYDKQNNKRGQGIQSFIDYTKNYLKNTK